MKRPLAYITAAWLGGDSENAELAAQYCRTVYEAGFSPICPPLYLPLFLNDAVPEEHKSGIDMSRDLLRRSHVLVVCGHSMTEAMKNDIAVAQRLVGETLKFPTTAQEVEALLKRIGVDGVRYQEIFITSFDGDVLGLYDHLSEYENLDELNHLACLLSELTSSELETLEAVLDSGDHCSSVRDIINLTQNLDCYGFYPGVSDEETLGRIYVDDLEMLDVPDQVKPYFDYEAYGRDACIHENGHFAPGGYVVKESDHFVEVYHGLQDIPKEHKVFSFPKLSIREQMAAYQEIIDGSSLEGYRQMQKKDRGDR